MDLLRRPAGYSLLVALVLVGALAAAVALRAKAPPEVARLLPECDAIVYGNLKPLRAATHFDRTPVARSPEFQQFIDATGIVPERDLDAVAFALHRRDDPRGPNGPVGYSEVFEGRFDGPRLARYLASLATAKEIYAGREIFILPVGDPRARRMLRVAQLGYDTLAASNMPTPEQIHAMLDRHRTAASPFSSSSLLSELYGDVPVLSSAWAIGHIGLPFSEGGAITIAGLQLPLADDATFVASLRYVGSLHLRIEQVSPNAHEVARSTETLSALVHLLRSVELVQQPRTPETAALRQLLDSLKVEQAHDRAVLTGNIPLDLLHELGTPVQPPLSAPASH